jgi:hypothetical protein
MHVVGSQAKRGRPSEHLRHPYLISCQFESLRGSEFILSIYITFTCIDPLSYRPSLCDFLLLGVSHYRRGDQNNCKAELLVTCSLIRGVQSLLRQEPYKGAETGFPGKIRARKAYRRPKWVLYFSAQAGPAQDALAQTLLTSAPVCSSIFVLLRYAHPRLSLKQQLFTPGD